MTGAEQTAVVQAEFDLLVFQRVHRGSIGSFLRRLKAVGTKTVFFAADRFACDIISEFDAILTASESLRTYWIDQGREADRVFAVPDAIETPLAVIKRVDAHQSNSNLKLGWLGAEGHWHTVTRLKELLDHTPELSDLELVTISNHPHASLPWTRERVWNDLLGCDIAVVPADVSNPASLVKSNNRVSSLQAIGLPVICARIPSYEPSIVHGDTGFFADTDAEWIHALTALRDPNVRKTIALRGHARAWSLYHPNLIGPRFEAVVHTILD